MTDISLETVTGKLNRVGYDTLFRAMRMARGAGNANVELAHWLHHLLAEEGTDLSLSLDHARIDRARLLSDIGRALSGLRRGQTEMPGISAGIVDLLDRGWHHATLQFGETQIRTGHLLVAGLSTAHLRQSLAGLSAEFRKLGPDDLVNQHRTLWAPSVEETLRPIDGSGVTAAGTGAPETTGQRTALDRYSQDLTARAASGTMDPITGRDAEIRQAIDVLMRRRQNNPILTGEAGVGKTAVVEGLAQRIVAGDVPPALRGVKLLALDITLMQAGAAMKGEFEQRLRSVIDEVQSSPIPIILFIDEAHTLIGAGGQAGTGDAANILKPPLARGTLRTIAATTWSEYRQYIEKDPALTRRFQPIHVDEPDLARAVTMLRAIVPAMEAHHKVRIADAAVVDAVELSRRYIPARQLPDKAVSLLDTACARVAISQAATPAAIADLRAGIAALDQEATVLAGETVLGTDAAERLAEIAVTRDDLTGQLTEREARWEAEAALVAEIAALRVAATAGDAAAADVLAGRLATLAALPEDDRMVFDHVDAASIAAVVSDWTGIPLGRMVKDDIETVLTLPAILGERVIGQDHALATIARRIETSRAGLDNPEKPVGVFLLCGPSGVGKTETALALADALYGGAESLITINMSEFQEAHTVSALKGAPPGYVGFGEGGRLTEAVRRRPYSVVLLDEVEKAHPDVHELFFQVFDKGIMEDGNGRRIDFRNTLILLTSNVGTDIIMDLARLPAQAPDPETLALALRPELLGVFPPALIGRLVVVPYYPLSPSMLAGIVRLQLDRIGARIRAAHDVDFGYSDAVVEHIVSRCQDPDSGGRMIDNILTNTLLPMLARRILHDVQNGAAARSIFLDDANNVIYVKEYTLQ